MKNNQTNDDLFNLVNVNKTVLSPEGSLTILSDISLRIKEGESVAIIGTSGAGKSTLLSLMAGLDVPTSGQINFKGNDLVTLNEDQRAEIRATNVGFVFQSFHLIPSLNALENVMLPLELNNKKSAKKHAQQILNELGLQARVQHYPHQLSGGEKQRVAIARAFAAEPSILFADEPTGNLDTKTGENIMNTMFELNRDIQTTLILVTHDSQLASKCLSLIHI